MGPVRVTGGRQCPGRLVSADIDDAIAFVDAMREVDSLLPGISAEAMERVPGDARSLAVEIGSSTSDLAGGLYQVISAFGDTPDATGPVCRRRVQHRDWKTA